MDNDKKHTSSETKKWLESNKINHWTTPAQSPVELQKKFFCLFFNFLYQDLNPIELVWHELKTFIRHNKPKSKTEFIRLIGKFWKEELTPEKCRRYICHVN